MRLEDLSTLSSTSVELMSRALAGYDVMSALPVTGDRPDGDYVLAATPQGLAIVAERRAAGARRHHHVIIRWARWSAVHLGVEDVTPDEDDGAGLLIVRVGRKAFAALAQGGAGRQALRDFRLTVQRFLRTDRGYRGYIDYDAASTLPR